MLNVIFSLENKKSEFYLYHDIAPVVLNRLIIFFLNEENIGENNSCTSPFRYFNFLKNKL